MPCPLNRWNVKTFAAVTIGKASLTPAGSFQANLDLLGFEPKSVCGCKENIRDPPKKFQRSRKDGLTAVQRLDC
jgi:hypothetical protein